MLDVLLLSLNVLVCVAAAPFLVILSGLSLETVLCVVTIGAAAGAAGAMFCMLADHASGKKLL